MDQFHYELLVDRIRRSATLQRIEAMIEEHVGGTLHVMLCKDRTIVRMLFDGRSAGLSDFCRMMRGTSEGAERCGSCRWLMAMQASCLGATEYSCHGGLWAAVAPAVVPRKAGDEFVVVATCGFGDSDREEGWKEVRSHILGIDLPEETLRAAYNRLTIVPNDKRAIVLSIVEVAASVVGELTEVVLAKGPESRTTATRKKADVDAARAMDEAFSDARKALSDKDAATGSALVDVVMAVVAHNPSLPFTVSSVARVARLSPNHFSNLFKKHCGNGFSSYLESQRLRLASELLGDLTLTVNEVADRSGFHDAAYFSRRFKKSTGYSPLDYRRGISEAQQHASSPVFDSRQSSAHLASQRSDVGEVRRFA